MTLTRLILDWLVVSAGACALFVLACHSGRKP